MELTNSKNTIYHDITQGFLDLAIKEKQLQLELKEKSREDETYINAVQAVKDARKNLEKHTDEARDKLVAHAITSPSKLAGLVILGFYKIFADLSAFGFTMSSISTSNLLNAKIFCTAQFKQFNSLLSTTLLERRLYSGEDTKKHQQLQKEIANEKEFIDSYGVSYNIGTLDLSNDLDDSKVLIHRKKRFESAIATIDMTLSYLSKSLEMDKLTTAINHCGKVSELSAADLQLLLPNSYTTSIINNPTD